MDAPAEISFVFVQVGNPKSLTLFLVKCGTRSMMQ